LILEPKIFSKYFSIVAAQSTRLGGISKAPYNFMNLGSNTADDKEDIEKNKKIFTNAIGFQPSQVVRSKQIHGNDILIADESGYYEGYDAIMTNKKNLLLAISTADCCPILLYDRVNEAIAAVHAGWKGSYGKLVYKTLAKMIEIYGSKGEDIVAYIGPCIGECSFEVDADVAQYFDGPFVRFDSQIEKYLIDLKNYNKSQLLQHNVKEENVEISEFDTYERTDLFYSHRKEKGITGRMWSVIGLKI
jgi:YfiH family protein